MAQTKKSTKKQVKEEPKKRGIRREVRDSILSIVFLATTILLVLSVYRNILGGFGNVISIALHGAFGICAYVLPVFTAWLGVELMREKRRVPTTTRLWTGLILTVSASALCYLFESGVYFKMYSFLEFFTDGIGDMPNRFGGVVGGLVAYPLICLLTKTGFAIIFIALLIICALTFFDITLYQIWCKIKEPFTKPEEEKVEKEDDVEVVIPKIVRTHKKSIDVFVDDETEENDEAKPFDDIFVDPEVESTAVTPFFVHDDVKAESYVTTADMVVGNIDRSGVFDPPEKITVEDGEDTVTSTKAKKYKFPPKSLLETPKSAMGISKSELEQTEQKLIQTLSDFGIEATMLGASVGPIVTRYELAPSKGVRVSKITSLADDIALSLAATSIRIEAPIPGKAAVGIEIPNKQKSTVFIKELLDAPEFTEANNPLTVALGRDISGNLVYGDLSDMPHLLVAGATGSGKSVCINTMLMSLLYKASPDDVKLILIDPKVVELEVYNKIPHLIVPVVSNSKKAAGALLWAVNEMEKRYNMFFSVNVRNVKGYNDYAEKHDGFEKMPQIVIVIDELADLMMTSAKEVEDYIVRLTQKARAAGIYLIIATQRPSVNVVTGLIKANVPSRVAFAVTSQIDSRVILDGSGAEKLLGKGDMLFKGRTMNAPRRVQCCFVSDSEVESVVEWVVKHSGGATYDESVADALENYAKGDDKREGGGSDNDDDLDDCFWEAVRVTIETGKASTSNLQRRLQLGYQRAARIMDTMEEKGIIGPYEGSKPRQITMTMAEYQELMVKKND